MWLERILDTFGRGNVYAEIQRHRDRDEEARNQAVIALAKTLQVPLVATNGVCHVQPAAREILDVFTCLHHKVTLASAGRLLAKNAERHLKSGAEMARLFAAYPDAVANTVEISAQLPFDLTDLGYEFPRYASAYLKVHFLAAFTCAMLNNQPMGFYAPPVLIKDAQRHGLRVLPIDITQSDWDCTLENVNLRLGLRYVKGLRVESATRVLREREEAPFSDIDDLARRVPELRKDEMSKLAATGALNPLNAQHRRDALWKSSRAARAAGPLLIEVPENEPSSPLQPMTADERLIADYGGTGVNIGCHPMFHRRAEMDALRVTPAVELAGIRSGKHVRIAGNVIVRQRPGTAKGIVFLSIEDETGIANAVIMPDVFDANRLLIVSERWLLVEGPIQNVDNVIHVRAKRIMPLGFAAASVPSHDFH